MNWFLFAVLLLSKLAFAKDFSLMVENGVKDVKTQTIDGAMFSQGCAQKDCLAWKTYQSPKMVNLQEELKKGLKKKNEYGHPASKFCSLQEGKNLILRDEKNRQYDFCQFKDGSMVESWGLYDRR